MSDLSAWRALVEKELAGASFDKLVQKTPEGIALEPLYTEAPAESAFVRGATAAPFKLCMRVGPGIDAAAELDGGAEALWCKADDRVAIEVARSRGSIAIVDGPGVTGDNIWSAANDVVAAARAEKPRRSLRISTVAFHDAGADAADELALGLSNLVATLRQLDDAKVDLSRVGPLLWAQVAVGRDTFGEICKLRALRVLWHKVLSASGVTATGLDAIHAVCSSRTLTTRDPWVNMLRVTTQVFAAALGGAQLVTPLPFDAAFATPSALGQRVARNTALVLREESFLGRVLDPGGGSYYLETRTDALAREAWARFTAIEREGGIVQLLRTNQLHARLEAAWKQRAAALAKRKEPVLGVSEFANLTETLPGTPAAPAGVHRDAEAFEALRTRIEAAPREVSIVPLGLPKEYRARVGFAEGFFGIAGLRATPREIGPGLDVAVLCGSDERYATDAVATARALREAGARSIVLAGRPGDLEADLRAAGVNAFIFVGCDVLATLEEVLS